MTTLKPIDEIPITTMTVIVSSSITINLSELFERIKINDKIIFTKYKSCTRGNYNKKKKTPTEHFKNSITVIYCFRGQKNITTRISANGGIHVTGCSDKMQIFEFLKYICKILQKSPHIFINHGRRPADVFLFFIDVVMTNIKYNIDYKIDRPRLDEYLNLNTDFKSFYLVSAGCAGVNIKYAITDDQLNSDDFVVYIFECNLSNLTYTIKHMPHRLFIECKSKDPLSDKYTTALAFQSGSIILSSINKDFMREPYEILKDVFLNYKEEIKEILALIK